MQNGFDVAVYEKEAHLGERVREWTMLLHWALDTLLYLLPGDVLKDMRKAYTDPFHPYEERGEEVIPFYHGRTGNVVFRMPSHAVRRVSRTRFRGLCTRGIDVHWGKAFQALEVPDDGGAMTVRFADGSSAEADFVIGADGSGSKVRRCLFGEDEGSAKPTEHAICSSVVNYGDADKARFLREPHPVCYAAVDPLGSMMTSSKAHQSQVLRSNVLISETSAHRLTRFNSPECPRSR